MSTLPLLALAGCADRRLEMPEDERDLACMVMAGGEGHWSDGSVAVILDAEGFSGTACLCLTEEEFVDGSRSEALNVMLYERCEELAAPYEFAWNDCQQNYQAGTWLPGVFWARDEFAWMGRNSPPCSGDEVEGCSLTAGAAEGSGWGSLLLVLPILWGGARRYRRRA